MTPFTTHAAGAYAQVGLETGVAAAHPHKLVEMLFDASLGHIAQARDALAAGDRARRGACVSRAVRVVEDGLRASLDHRAGGSLAAQLDALYEYTVLRLASANASGSPEGLEEAARILAELRDGWRTIAPAAAAPAAGVRLAA
jgi:flagellar protein FliS